MNFPKVEMKILTDSGIQRKDIDIDEAIEQTKLGSVKINDCTDFEFDKELYIERLYEWFVQDTEKGRNLFKDLEAGFDNQGSSDMIFALIKGKVNRRLK